MVVQPRETLADSPAAQGMPAMRGALSPSSPLIGVRWAELISFALVGLTLGIALIVAVDYIGSSADAHTSATEDFTAIAAPIPVLQTKEDPLIPPSALQQATLGREDMRVAAFTQVVARAGKGDMIIRPVFSRQAENLAVQPRRRPRGLKGRLLASPPVWKLEQGWRMARLERARVLAARKRRLRELSCLAKAVYFEARSEGLKGQMAVAKVILNRVRDPRFPNTVCGVVYQGAERRNGCQFSFTCDGRSDYPSNARQWRVARRVALKALRGQIRLRGMEGVAFYHADYVRPTWASMMRPVIKIGHHIFYRDS